MDQTPGHLPRVIEKVLGPGSLTQDYPGDAGQFVLGDEENLQITLAVLNVGADERLVRAGHVVLVQCAWVPLATISLAHLRQAVAIAFLLLDDVVEADLCRVTQLN